jgi:LytS/YehU family sensor histidine kinase
VVSIAHAHLFYRRAQERDRLEASLAKARMEALKMQLQPHFLFNSLNAIVTLVHLQPDAAEAMIGALSDLLRLTLETSGEQESPISRELEFVQRYLAIEHARFGDRLRFQLEVDDPVRNALAPTFLLQPLVENAVRHGLEPRSGAGLLTIRARRDGAQLHLEVIDDGVGLPAEKPLREGIGIANTRARLRELYGDAASLELHNSSGVKVEIRLPFHTA